MSVAPFPLSARTGSDAPGEVTGPADPEASCVELQSQVNELRADPLDERDRRIGQQLEATGVAFVVLGIVIRALRSGSTPGSRLLRPRQGPKPRIPHTIS